MRARGPHPWFDWLVLLGALLALAVPYVRSTYFVLDDYRFLSNLRQIEAGEPGALAESMVVENRWDDQWWVEEGAVVRFFRPWVTPSYGVDRAIWGESARGYGITNALLFSAATLLVWRALRRVSAYIATKSAVTGAFCCSFSMRASSCFSVRCTARPWMCIHFIADGAGNSCRTALPFSNTERVVGGGRRLIHVVDVTQRRQVAQDRRAISQIRAAPEHPVSSISVLGVVLEDGPEPSLSFAGAAAAVLQVPDPLGDRLSRFRGWSQFHRLLRELERAIELPQVRVALTRVHIAPRPALRRRVGLQSGRECLCCCGFIP